MWGLWIGVVLAGVACGLCAVLALRGARVPVYGAVIGPLIAVVAVRRSFVALGAGATADQIATQVELVGSMSTVFVVAGLLLFALGMPWTRRLPGAPALSQVGALTVIVGVIWSAWAAGEAALWRADGAPLEALVQIQAVHADELRRSLWIALAGAVGMYLPAAVWGLRREGWPGLGDGVAAMIIVLITLSTGQPARRAMEAAQAPWLGACAEREGVQPAAVRSFDRHPVLRARRCQGDLERLDSRQNGF